MERLLPIITVAQGTAGLNQLTLARSQLQGLRLDQPESHIYGLRVGVGPAVKWIYLIELFEGLEQDLSGAFPEGTATVGNLGSANARLASVISAHTALEGADDTVSAADSSQPGGLAVAKFVVGPKAQTGGHPLGGDESQIPSVVSPIAGVLFGGSSQLKCIRAASRAHGKWVGYFCWW